MNQFNQAWSFYFKNWKSLLPISIPLLVFFSIVYYALLPKILPYLQNNQTSQFIEFYESNKFSFDLINLFSNVIFVIFIGALSAQFYSLSANKKPLRTFEAYSKSYSKVVPLFLASIFSSILISFGFMLLIFPGIYLFARFSLFPFYIVIENKGPILALKLSWINTDKYGAKLSGYTFIFFILMLVTIVFSSSILSFLGLVGILTLISIEFCIFTIALCYLYFSLYMSMRTL
tara:strand:- start:102 stop:797 length:696 start_codon:yes stop_codon:yes gene_type:complete